MKMIDQSDIVVVIFLTLLGMTAVFGFGLWITCKRKFLLLKLYTVVLAAFVLVQIVAVIALATGSGNSDECVFCLHARADSPPPPPRLSPARSRRSVADRPRPCFGSPQRRERHLPFRLHDREGDPRYRG